MIMLVFAKHVFVGRRFLGLKKIEVWFYACINFGVIEECSGDVLDAAFYFGIYWRYC